MGNPHDASNLELLHLYLDGELDGAREHSLFHAVADDPELRAEMRQLLAFRAVFQRDSARLLPPERLKRSIMAGVDLPAPPARSAGWATFRRTVLLPLSTAIVAAVVTSLFFLGREAGDDGARSGETTLRGGGTVVENVFGRERPKGAPGEPTDVAARNAGGREDRHPSSALPTGPVFATSERSRLQVSSVDTTLRSADASAARVWTVEPAAIPPERETERPEEPTEARRVDPGAVHESIAADQAGYTVQVRSFAMRSFPTGRAPSQSAPLFENMSVGVLHALGDHDRVGVEVGQESFSQVFHGIDSGRSVRYEQNPILPWAGGVYQRRWGAIEGLGGIGPFLQLFGGGTRLGPLGRVTLGIEYSPGDRVSFMLGADGSALLYRSEGLWYGTTKLGVSYGTSITF